MESANQNILEIENLSTAFLFSGKPVAVTKDITFNVRRGEILGIVGESGSGKSVTAKTVMRLLPSPPSSVLSGSIILDGKTYSPCRSARCRTCAGMRCP